MSVINQMLLDLEKRGAPLGGKAEEMAVRPVASGERRRAPLLLGLAGIMVAALAAWSVWGPAQPGREPAPATGAGTAAAIQAAAPGAPADVAGARGGGLSLRLSAAPAFADAREPRPAVREPAASKPKPAARSLPAATPAATATTREETPAPAPRAETKVVKATQPELPAPTGESSIDKKPKELTPEQQAEQVFRKAVGLMQQGRAHEAMDACWTALRIDPGHEAARQTLAALLLEAKRSVEAEQILREGLRLNPTQPRLAMILARVEADRGALADALATLEPATPQAGQDAEFQGFMAALLQRLGRHREAVERYFAVLQLFPQSGVWLMGLGISLQAENRLPEAREAFQRAKASNSLAPELVAFVDQRLAQLPAGR